jgi:hypothetical protein|tara:strand:+ start:282 stop:1253 length:972 start_codon:yes stop_codon:yes gene_type:complete
MKNITLAILLCASFSINAQVNTNIRIYHTLGTQLFQMNSTTQNDLTQDYQVTRIEYYLTKFSVVHDGGQITAISDDTVALISATDGTFSSIELGSLNITDVEAVKFHIGVYSPVNNEDPSLYPSSHPLAPKSPSMHWGWASGYRFLVYEGVGGVNFSQVFQLHALGNNNYFETTVSAVGEMAGGNLIIALDADYTRGVDNIDVSNGVVAHGVDLDDLTALENFRDFVFSQNVLPLSTSTDDIESDIQWGLFPNPSSDGKIVVSIDSDVTIDKILITDLLGKEVSSVNYSNLKSVEIDIATSGIYLIQLLTNSSIVSTKRVVIQ